MYGWLQRLIQSWPSWRPSTKYAQINIFSAAKCQQKVIYRQFHLNRGKSVNRKSPQMALLFSSKKPTNFMKNNRNDTKFLLSCSFIEVTYIWPIYMNISCNDFFQKFLFSFHFIYFTLSPELSFWTVTFTLACP